METVIVNCDFSGVDDSAKNEFRRGMKKYTEELSSLDCDGILGILKAFQKKVCVNGFPAAQSPGVSFAQLILSMVLDTIR